MNHEIIIIDYGLGNVGSIQKALKRININSKITSNLEEIKSSQKIILSGVGNFKKGIENLEKMSILKVLNEKVADRQSLILGICLGMQLMTKYSEEGKINGFGWISASTYLLDNKKIKVPHNGWNNLSVKKSQLILKDIYESDLFYFNHSYYIKCDNHNDILATTEYGIEFVSIFNKDNIYGCQFHPEKSHSLGLQFLMNFSKL